MRDIGTSHLLGTLIIFAALSTWVITSIYLVVSKNSFSHYTEMSAVVLSVITIGAGMLAKKRN